MLSWGVAAWAILCLNQVTSGHYFTSLQDVLPRPGKSVMVEEGQAVARLECPFAHRAVVVGETPSGESGVIWILDKARVVITAGYTTVIDKGEKYDYVVAGGLLQINHVTGSDAGMYWCLVAGNETGNHYKVAGIHLTVDTLDPDHSHCQTKEPSMEGLLLPRKHSLRRALITGLVAFIMFTLSCTLYHYRWKPPTVNNPSSRNWPHSSSFPTPSTTTATSPPLIITTSSNTGLEMGPISSKSLPFPPTDGSERPIFLQPPSTLYPASTSNSPRRTKTSLILYPPPFPSKMYLATPEPSHISSSSSENEGDGTSLKIPFHVSSPSHSFK